MKVVRRLALAFAALLIAATTNTPSARAQTKDPLRTWATVSPSNGISGNGPLVSFAGRLLRIGNEGCLFSPDLSGAAPLRTLHSADGFAGYAQSPTALVAVFTETILPPLLTGQTYYRTTVQTTVDGVRWVETLARTRPFDSFRQVVFTGDKFVLMTASGQSESADGMTWSSASHLGPISAAVRFRGMWYAGTQQSTDAVAWTNWSAPPPIANAALAATATVLLAWNSTGGTATSADGTTWSATATLAPQIRSVQAVGGKFYADLDGRSYAVSTDGANWQRVDGTGVVFASGLVAHSDSLVALDAQNRLWSGSGTTWNVRIAQPRPAGSATAHAAAEGVALYSFVEGAARQLWLSFRDGPLELIPNAPSAEVRGVARATDGAWLAVFADGAVWGSSDGRQWSASTVAPLPDEPTAIAFARGRFAVLGKRAVFTSTDGRSWLQTSASFAGLRAARGQFFAFRHNTDRDLTPSVFRSNDAITWTSCNVTAPGGSWIQPSFTRALHHFSLAETTDRLVLASGYTVWGDAARTMTGVFRSTDGANWEYVTALAEGTPSVVALGPRFVLGTPALHSSFDGTGWTPIPDESRTGLETDDDTLRADGLRVAHFILPRPGLSGLSTRGFVGTGDAAMIAGFVITGDRPRHTLLRASGGATLGDYGVRGTLADPAIELVRIDGPSAGTVATNDNWRDAANADEIAAVAQRLGEFPFPAGSTDAALTLSLEPGVYTLVVRGRNGATGVALAEVYDADASPDDTSDRRIVALSTRLNVKTGDAVAISGLIVQGTRSKQVLLRGLGPELARLGVSGALRQPRLLLHRVVDGAEVLQHTANRWADETNAPDLAIAFDECGVSALPVASDDSAMLVELQPGAYTIHLQSQDGSAGNGLIEAYEVR